MTFLLNNFPKIEAKSSKYKNNTELKNYFYKDNTIFRKKSQSTFINKKPKTLGYLYEIVLFGLNYHAKRLNKIRKDFYLDLQKSHRILLDEKIDTPFKTRIFKRRIVLFGYDKRSLIILINAIKAQRPRNSYFGHGVIANFDSFSLKPGKVRQR